MSSNDAAVAAIQFALQTDESMEFLRLWNEGEFDVIREEWSDVPNEVFIGADPLLNGNEGIPVEFYNEHKAGKNHPEVETVNELIEQLERLPGTLEIRGDFPGEKITLTVPNYSFDAHLTITSES